jgi:hypothetical protein
MSISVPFFTITTLQPETDHLPVATRNKSPPCNQKQITFLQPETNHQPATRNRSPSCNQKQITTLQPETDHLPATCMPDTGPLIYPILEKAAKTPPSFATNKRNCQILSVGLVYMY